MVCPFKSLTPSFYDICRSSLLEEDNSSTDHLHGSSSYSAKSNYSMLSADNYLSEFMPSHTYGMGSSRYLKTHDFSPSAEWNNADIATSCPQVKVRISIPFFFPFYFSVMEFVQFSFEAKPKD